jgi:hypothetical protein
MKSILALILLGLMYVVPASAVSRAEITFNIGPAISESGNVSDLGEPNFNTGFGFNYFVAPNHGVGFAFNNEFDFDGSKEFPRLDNASISTFDIHYAYRFIKNKFQFVFEPGFGWQTLYDDSGDYYYGYAYYTDLSTAWIVDYKLFVRYVISEWTSGEMTSSGSFFIGAGIIHIFSTNDDLNGKDVSGNRLSALFQLGVGW